MSVAASEPSDTARYPLNHDLSTNCVLLSNSQ
ncbi:Uncharacterised protein [Vibrio cholerae]|nr:Uncharacterised protein [Vibrio cholerae]